MSTFNSLPDAYKAGNIEKRELLKRCKTVLLSNTISFVIFEEHFFAKVLEAFTGVQIDRSVMPSKDRIADMEQEIFMAEKAGENCASQPLGRVLLEGETVGYITNLFVCMPKTLPQYYRNTEPLLGGPTFIFPTQELVKELLPLVRRLHDRGVLHGDIKPANILYNREQSRFLFCDFGSARLQSSQDEMGANTIPYETPVRAQEGFEMEPLSREDDLYATGITMWELASSKDIPFWDIKDDTIEDVVAAGFQPNLYDVGDITTRGLIRSLLDQGFPHSTGFTPRFICIQATVVYSDCIAEATHTYTKTVHHAGCKGDDCGELIFRAPSPLSHVEQLPCNICFL